jgi:hypothetical protein
MVTQNGSFLYIVLRLVANGDHRLIDDRMMENVFSLASEREKFAFVHTVSYRFELLQSLVVQYLPTRLDAVRTALDATLRRKGLVPDALSRERLADVYG